MDKRIEQLCDERNSGNAWFVYLKPGFHLNGAHCFGEDTRKEVRETMKRVQPCACGECKPK